MDIDGTLTDSAMYYSKDGEIMKRFHTRDGMGIGLLRKNGIESAIITSENNAIVKSRAEKLNIENIVLGSRDKSSDLKELAKRCNLEMENLAFIGDDINDGNVITLNCVSACPLDAHITVRKKVDYICKNKGGYGAVREFAELILIIQDKSITLNENW